MLKYSSEVRLGEIIAAGSFVISALGIAFGWGGEFAGIKAAQAAQAVQGQRLESNIREVKDEVKDTGTRVRSLESRMDRARM